VARATASDLDRLVSAARVLWLGDNHRSARLHALQRALLARLVANGPPFSLVLEAIGDADEPHVADYVARRTDATVLRARLRARWDGSWLDDDGLDAAHYRALLAFARAHALPVHALEPTPRLPLPLRDAAIVARVRDLAARHPGRLLVVVVGQAHLLGEGDVVPRTGLPAVAVGGEPTPALLAAELPAAAGGEPGEPGEPLAADELVASDGGLLWFAALLPR